MKKNECLIVAAALIFTFGFILLRAGEGAVSLLKNNKKLVCGFNSKKDLNLFIWKDMPGEISRGKQVTEGKKCVKAVFSGRTTGWPGFELTNKKMLSNWEKFDFLCIDVFNPSDKAVDLSTRIDDSKTNDNDWTSYFYKTWKIHPGHNTLRIELHQLDTFNRVRTIKPKDIRKFCLLINYSKPRRKNPPVTLYFDNLRLVKARSSRFHGLAWFYPCNEKYTIFR